MNIIGISGRLVHTPELKTTPEGKNVCSFSVAVQRPGTKDKTDFITCVAWESKAEFVSKYFGKGNRIEISGILTSRKWEDKHKNKRTSYEVLCHDVSFGESKKESDSEPDQNFEEIPMSNDDLPF
ncbi:Single-stranded DNA-binding protein A [bioreactor metagenome]|uniref:Single-stranded DNA-binding protein A n=1 Tax=bioreactor metagenome TaxID=1076179 RepID=A0A645G8M8_9ZZZZ